MKIILGTAQFGLKYGISNKNGIPTEIELKSILLTAKKFGVNFLDTAQAYGNAELQIGKFSDINFEIITKFPKVSSEKELIQSLNKSCESLKTNSIYGYLAHNADVIINNPQLWNILLEAKESQKIRKIGFSLYYPEQLESLLIKKCVPDLVQLPYSIFDRKFENQLRLLKEIGTEIHVRSVFLQGLYFMNPNQLPIKLEKLKSSLNDLNKISKKYNVSVGEIALNYVIANPYIDKIVFGVETSEQLIQNINMVNNWKENPDIFSKITSIKIKDEKLLNPANW